MPEKVNYNQCVMLCKEYGDSRIERIKVFLVKLNSNLKFQEQIDKYIRDIIIRGIP